MTQYNNPTPIAVCLQGAWTPNIEHGLILIKRADNGGWSFPAGYIETHLDISAEEAARREFTEETGMPSPDELTLFHSTITTNGKLLLFSRSWRNINLTEEGVKSWQPTAEALDMRIAIAPEELCFPTHTDAMQMWFDQWHGQ